jgi:microcystin-dependent protein
MNARRPSAPALLLFALLAGCASVSRQELDQRLANLKAGSLPVGTVVAFAGESLPAGWLWCDGTEYFVEKYPALAAAIGRLHGSSDPETKFRVPDYRGRFLRGVDRGAGNDPDAAARTATAPGGARGDAVGSVQGHQIASHHHEVRKSGGSQPDGSERFQAGADNAPRGVLFSSAYGGSETRPVNAAVHWIIRAE